MRGLFFLCAAALVTPVVIAAQTPRTGRDSVARDSIARADSISIVRELERMQAGGDTTGNRPGGTPGQQGATNTRLLPDISVVGDMIADFSPKGSTQEGGARFGIREVEVALQAAVDPYFRGDVFLGVSDEEGISIEQAFITTTALPYGIEARLGRVLMPFGKQNQTHRHDLHTIEHSYIVQNLFSPEGLKGTGATLSKVFAPLGFYQEIQASVIDRFGESDESLVVDGLEDLGEPANQSLGGLGFAARLRNYWDLSESANIELGFSGITGKRERQLVRGSEPPGSGSIITPVGIRNQRQSVIAADLTYRWRPLQQGIYRSFILQAEYMQQRNPDGPFFVLDRDFVDAPRGTNGGGYVYARYQISRRGFVGTRFDYVADVTPVSDVSNGNPRAWSAYYEFFPSEFSKLVGGYERYNPGTSVPSGINRFIVQLAFSLGPHKPHPF